MTGGEIVAAVQAVGAVAPKMLSEDATTKAEMLAIARDTPAFRDAAKSFAVRQAIKEAVLLKIVRPLAKWAGVPTEYFEADFATELAAKMEGVPEEEVTTPPTVIAVPAIEGLAFSLDEPALKEMYLSLLASASDRRSTGKVHPAFAEIIRQLSSDEVPFPNSCLKAAQLPVVSIKAVGPDNPEGDFSIIQPHLLNWSRSGEALVSPDVPAYIDNWVRLGLVELDYGLRFTNDEQYAWVKSRPEFQDHRDRLHSDTMRVEYRKGVLQVTSFGARFATAVGVTSG